MTFQRCQQVQGCKARTTAAAMTAQCGGETAYSRNCVLVAQHHRNMCAEGQQSSLCSTTAGSWSPTAAKGCFHCMRGAAAVLQHRHGHPQRKRGAQTNCHLLLVSRAAIYRWHSTLSLTGKHSWRRLLARTIRMLSSRCAHS